MDTTEEPDWIASPSRGRRALGVIVASALVIAVAGAAYLRPSLNLAATAGPIPPAKAAAVGYYQLTRVQFVTPTTGWFAADLGAGEFAILNTSDAGRRWTRQLSGSTEGRGEYMRFFNATRGVFVLVGAQALIYSTSDGGRTWSQRSPLPGEAPFVLSAFFVDQARGWLLVRGGPGEVASVDLLRTDDGGINWINLGSPALPSDQPYSMSFADRDHGWLASRSVGPYLYTTADAGRTWNRFQLPAPSSGWPRQGDFFVIAEPTVGAGAVASVVNFTPLSGRSRSGASVVDYPPLTVRSFDGGGSVTDAYTTFVDTTSGDGLRLLHWDQEMAPSELAPTAGQVQLGSVDLGASWSIISPPPAAGSISYFDKYDWWWVGLGSWSTSSDAGKTWTPDRYISVPEPVTGTLQVLDAKHASFGAEAGTGPIIETTDDGGVTWNVIKLPPITP
jgi:photosystem II stability/assembly factor-like uncharacterized protein